jgi:rod shape-determining protein MreC
LTDLQHTEHKPMFTRGPSLGTRLFLLVIASISLMVLDHQRDALGSLRSGLSVAVYPIQVLVDLPFRVTGWTAETFSTRTRLLAENRRLRAESLESRVRLQRLAALEAENSRLRALLKSTPAVVDRVLVARILAVDLDPFRHRLVIDKGGRQDVYEGQAMLDADGIVGQITRVGPISSEAILISDPGHAIPVEVNRNGLRTIALGTGDSSRVTLPFLPNNADIEPGDLLVSSGLGGAFPAGYPVAEVVQVERRPGEPFMAVEAEPTGALIREREVLLVWGKATPDEGPLPADAVVSDDAPETAPGAVEPADAAAGADSPAVVAAENADGPEAGAEGELTAAEEGTPPDRAPGGASGDETAGDDPEPRP